MAINKLIPVKSLLLAVGSLTASVPWLLAQVPASSPSTSPVPALSPTATPNPGLQALPQFPDAAPSSPPTVTGSPAPDSSVLPEPAEMASPTPTPARRNPNEEPGDPTLNTSNSFWLENYPINDLYQYLARQADYQFFQNPFIDS